MTRIAQCASLAEVRSEIDLVDRDLVFLLAERGAYAGQTAKFKKTAEEVPPPQRVKAVMARGDALALEGGAEPAVAEATWRAMIAAFSDGQRLDQATLYPPTPQPN